MLNQRAMELLVQGRDLPWLLDQWVQRTPDKTFLIWAPPLGENEQKSEHRQWTYGQFDKAVKSVAAGLAEMGLTKGDRLLIHMENCPEYLITYFACARLGVVSVLTNTRSVAREMTHFCQSTGVTAAVTQPQFLTLVQEAAPGLIFTAVTDPIAEIGTYTPATIPFSYLLQCNNSDDHPTGAGSTGGTRSADPMADLRIQFTSGTTSRPKAVLSTHANAIYAAQQTALAYGLTKDDVCQVVVPLFHNNGLSTLVTSALWAGGTILLQPKFSASNFWNVALEYRATWTALPGAFFINALWNQKVPNHHFKFWIVAVSKAIEDKFKVQTRGHWGMTEMITLPLVGDPHHSGPELNIGRPIPGIEISIRNDQGQECQPGETGNLHVGGVRGITIFKEYANNPEANQKAFDKDGWFDTGDRIRIDREGHIFFVDRDKDMLRVGGENVSASEIEKVIRQLAWIKECAVVGQKHNMLDEVPVAFISLNGNAPENPKETLIGHCQQHLADFKVIHQVYIIDDFPRSTLAKIAKHKLKENLPELES